MIRIAINGFGRIGRAVTRLALEAEDVEVVAINNGFPDVATAAHLFKYDSVHGIYPHEVSCEDDGIVVDGKKIKFFSILDPKLLPWQELGIDIVVESTGRFNDGTKACAHLEAGAKKVVLTAPGKNVDATIVMGVNEGIYDAANHKIVSNASCTTNCLAPVAKVLDEQFGIVKGLMTTIHAYTNDQNIADCEHKDLRRARAGALSMIPTTTGAAKAVALVLPQLQGKLNGFAVRVPTPNVSMVDLVVELGCNVTAEQVNAALKQAAAQELFGILEVSDLPLVSVDFNGTECSATVDALSTMAIGDNLVKVIAWYDNEWGYSNRVLNLVQYMGSMM